MAKVVWTAGIEYVSGALIKGGKKGQHTHAKMLLATHRKAATTNPNCNRIYVRNEVQRSTPLSTDELALRERFKAVAAMVQARKKDLTKLTQDQIDFKNQRDHADGKKTMKAYYWYICGQEYDAEHPRT